jgi:cardiolipin synthase
LWIVTVVWLVSCVTVSETPRRAQPVAVVGASGALSLAQSKDVVAKAAADAPDPEAIKKLEALMEGVSDQPLFKDNHVTLLVDGPATYEAMLEAIGTASRYVHLETYIFNEDEIGRKFAAALAKKGAEGVEVRVIYDSLGSRGSSDEFFGQLKDAGVVIVEFHPVNPIDGGNPLNVNVRDHRKILVVDGQIAFTGGLNIDRNYSSSSRKSRHSPQGGWRDTHIAVKGPAVVAFQRLFLRTWAAQGGEKLGPEERYFTPPPKPAGKHLVRVLSATGGEDEVSPIRIAYQYAMEAAAERIWITTSYFAPDPEFLRTMREGAERGVDVRIAVAGEESDAPMLVHASRSFYGELLRSGVRIYESNDTMLHAKTAVIDGVWSTVGSSNLDYRSFIHNNEVNAVIVGEEFARAMEALFLKDLERAQPISLAQWEDRPIFDRMKEAFSRAFQYWL